MNKNTEYIDSLAYCGLICDLCFKKDKCDGCKKVNNTCERNCSVKGCYQKSCCLNKDIDGCWECEDIYKCKEGIYSLGDFSKVKAFAICIKEDGRKKFVEYVLKNIQKILAL